MCVSDDIYEDVYSRVSPLGLDVECVGGGRILHEPDKKKLFVYGYSQVTLNGQQIQNIYNNI